jgi:hypothetical protein
MSSVSAKDNMTLLFSENGDMISMNKKRRRKILVEWFGNFVYHMHNSNKMVACTFFRIKGLKHINSGCVLRKWKKVREPLVMIRRTKARIIELVMHRQIPMDAREMDRRKHY